MRSAVSPRIARFKSTCHVDRLHATCVEAVARCRDVLRGGQLDRPVEQPRRFRRSRRRAFALPDVEGEVVVVATGADERGAVHVRDQVKADQVAVERERLGDVADVQVHVADGGAGIGLGLGLAAGDEIEQSTHVQWVRCDRFDVREIGPALARVVGGELDSVAVGVGQIDRLGDSVVGGALDRSLADHDALGDAGEFEAARVEQGHVVQTGVPADAARAGRFVQDDQLLAACREPGLIAVAARELQPQDVAVERDRAVELGDLQVGGAERECDPEAARGVRPGLR